jgi:hypothetical protein
LENWAVHQIFLLSHRNDGLVAKQGLAMDGVIKKGYLRSAQGKSMTMEGYFHFF